MKNLKYIVATLILINIACAVKAQSRRTEVAKADSVMLRVNLTNQQRVQMNAIITDKQAVIDSMMKNAKMDRAVRIAAITKIIEERKLKLDAILTPQQRAEFKKQEDASISKSFSPDTTNKHFVKKN